MPPFVDSVLPVVEANKAEIVRNDFSIGDHVRILPTPGHTPGHVAFAFGRGKDDAMFAGDLMHTPLQTRHPDLSPKFDVDPAQAAVTRRNFLERYCDTDTLCCTAHFPSPSTGKSAARAMGLRARRSAVAGSTSPLPASLGRGRNSHGEFRVRGSLDQLSSRIEPLTPTPGRGGRGKQLNQTNSGCD